MPLVQGVVVAPSPTSIPDSTTTSTFLQGKQAELMVNELHGKYYTAASRGTAFQAVTATMVITLFGNNLPTLFNPLGSGVIASLIRISLTYTTGTPAVAGIGLAYHLNCGASQATAGAILTFTNITPTPCLIGGTTVAKCRFATTNTFTGTPTIFMGLGIGETPMAITNTNNPVPLIVDFDGSLGVAPGNALQLGATVTTSTGSYIVHFVWEEIPV